MYDIKLQGLGNIQDDRMNLHPNLDRLKHLTEKNKMPFNRDDLYNSGIVYVNSPTSRNI